MDETGEVKEPVHPETQTPELCPEDLTEQVAESDEIQQPVTEQLTAVQEKESEDAAPEQPEATTVPDVETTLQAEPLLTELPTTPDNYCGELQEAIEVGAIGMINKQEILEQLKELVANAEQAPREQADKLKQAYYRTVKAETDELKKIFIENGGEEADFEPPTDETASILKNLLAEYKQKRAVLHEKDERTKEENYARKLQLIDRLQVLVDSQDDFNKRYNEFKEIQQKWKELSPVPQEQARELWRNYQIQSERFYDLVKINNQFRDYDFKKNLEMKTALCEAVEKLVDETDVVSAYHQSQKLFQQWREIGPVARDLREKLWNRFKEASAAVNKKHQAHFDLLKISEEENLKAKTALCEAVEAIDFESLKTLRHWDRKVQEVIAMQKKWYTIGFASKKQNIKIFDRFRKACDLFFDRKGVFYKSIKKDMEKNLQRKRELIEKAEMLKIRTDWKEATKAVIEIQHEWKKIGPVAHKHADVIWKQFMSACDYFFEQKNSRFSSQKTEESTNLETKRLLLKKIESIDTSLSVNEALTALRLLIAEWNTVGHVPFKDKDSIYKAFRNAVDKQYDRLNVAQTDRRVQQYRTALTGMADGGHDKGKLHSERDKLMRMYERIKNELQTYENNVGFFNVSSKGGGNLLKEMENKISRLKDDMILIVKKIDAIDESLEAES
jgi:hypothetical protein